MKRTCRTHDSIEARFILFTKDDASEYEYVCIGCAGRLDGEMRRIDGQGV